MRGGLFGGIREDVVEGRGKLPPLGVFLTLARPPADIQKTTVMLSLYERMLEVGPGLGRIVASEIYIGHRICQ